MVAHLCVSQYAEHGSKRRYLSSELCVTMMYILFFQVNCPEHWTHVQSGLYPDEILGDNKFRLCYDYLGATFNYGSGMSKLDAYCVY